MFASKRFLSSRLFMATLFIVCLSQINNAYAVTSIYTDKPSWERSIGTPTVIDFSVTDNGAPITNPPADQYVENLKINGVAFSPVQSYWNQAVYVGPTAPIRATLPPGTTAFAADMGPFYDVPEGYLITASIGGQVQTFHHARQRMPWQYDFFALTSTEVIEWVEFRHETSFMVLDNFWYFVNIVPFASFTSTLDIKAKTKGGKGSFTYQGTFALGAGSSGLSLATNDVVLNVGGVAITIPADGFVAAKRGDLRYNSTTADITIAATLSTSGTENTLVVDVTKKDFAVPTNPVPITLKVGMNSGTSSAVAKIKAQNSTQSGGVLASPF